MEYLLETFGEPRVLLALGLSVGLVFGIAAQRSRFCLRAATVEVAEGRAGPKLSIWLIAFFAALFGVQLAIATGLLSVDQARPLASVGSVSGAIIGGLMFGVGMILARGCASRLLVLSATGNLRALVTGLVLTIVAQSSFNGVLSPLREGIAGLWTLSGGPSRHLLSGVAIGSQATAVLAGIFLCAAIIFAQRHRIGWGKIIAGGVVGLTVAAGWIGTYAIASQSFEVVALTSVTFTGPSTDTLMRLVTSPNLPLSFGFGLVPGVFLGSAIAALFAGEWRIQRFGPDTPMEVYLVGAALMGFGSMLAGGCAVGAGLSGGAILAVTAWIAVFSMWVGAVGTQIVLRLGRSAVVA